MGEVQPDGWMCTTGCFIGCAAGCVPFGLVIIELGLALGVTTFENL